MYEKIEFLLNSRGISAYKLCKDIGLNRSLVSQWKSGAFKPKQDKLQLIADYFNVPLSYFYEDQPQPIYEVAAGQGRINDYVSMDDAVRNMNDDEYSTVRIVGDSMLPTLHDGDLLRVHHVTDIIPSDFTMVKVNGDEVTCKHCEITSDGIWLRAENKDVFKDTFYSVQDVLTLPVTIIGKATEIVSRKL